MLLGQRLKLQTCLQTLSMYARNYNETVENATEMENTESKNLNYETCWLQDWVTDFKMKVKILHFWFALHFFKLHYHLASN